MRMYMTILGGEKDIKVREIKFDNRNIDDHKPPEIFIKIERKYEDTFMRPQMIKLHDKYGNPLFTAVESRLNFRCYESDYDKFNGIEIVARELKITGVGSISKHYVQKLLMNVCNAKLVKHIPSKKEIREQKKLEAFIEEMKARDAPRKKMEYRLRMRRYPVFLQRIRCCWYYFRLIIKNRLVFKTNVYKIFNIIPKALQDTPT